jgi:hypothetical protein
VTGESFAPTFWLVASDAEHSALVDPRAPIISFAPSLRALTVPLIVALQERAQSVRLPYERFWMELRGGSTAREANSVLAFSVAPDRLTSITAEGQAFTVERRGLYFPRIDEARAAGELDAQVLHVVYTGLFVAMCALLDAPGIHSRTVERTELRLGKDAPPVAYTLVEMYLSESAAADLRAWIAAQAAE